MLQARLFNYADAQRYRLGVNYHQIPVNQARCPVHSNHRDGQGRVDGNYGALPHYEPNSFGQWQGQPQFSEPPLKLTGNAAHWSYDKDDHNYFEQPGKLFRLMNDGQKEALFGNTGRAMGDAPEFIKFRHIRNCHAADPAYGAGVAKALGINLEKALASKRMTLCTETHWSPCLRSKSAGNMKKSLGRRQGSFSHRQLSQVLQSLASNLIWSDRCRLARESRSLVAPSTVHQMSPCSSGYCADLRAW